MPSIRSLFTKLGATRGWADLGRFLAPADRTLLRATGGRFGVGTPVGLRTLLLTTVGRQSGQSREVALLYITHGDGLVVIGSNWGGERHPGWTANLLAEPRATVTRGGRRTAVRARLLTGEERRKVWEAVAAYWPAYDAYARRAARREIRVFLLELPQGE
ncbi:MULTISPECIES: nitroreductase family deazaflavin-dependent oxidoreductase [unclassified Streptomyces]|uniref:nitroreductase family deazaflavin-dependent oxidoreductase n=1 Tax=unclassified Streptomyces TaxID=2593676 RepID=UPI002109D212|nr:nitroreductase family deazaflavin-dependent oxidoreductase [Streptomyces sp. DvalAA-14]